MRKAAPDVLPKERRIEPMACVKDLLKLSSLRDVHLAAGYKGVYRTISWPNIAQTVSIREWLLGGDVILLSGVGLSCTAELFNRLIDQALEKDAACLIVFLSPDHIPTTPAATLAYAEALGFPVLETGWTTQIAAVIADISRLLTTERYQEEEVSAILEELLYPQRSIPSDNLRTFIQKNRLNGRRAAAVVEFPEIADTGYFLRQTILPRTQSVNHIIREVKTIYPAALWMQRKMDLVFLLPAESGDTAEARRVFSALCREIRSRYPGMEVHAGLGRVYEDPARFPESAREAEKALCLCRRERECVSFEELGLFQLLMEIPDQEKVWRYAIEKLQPLLDYDRLNRKNLMGTLETYLHTNCNAMETARRLYIHRNTLNYQLSRIRSLLGMDLESADERNRMMNILMIYRYCRR